MKVVIIIRFIIIDFCFVSGIVFDCRELVNWWWVLIGMFGLFLWVLSLFMGWVIELGLSSLFIIMKYVIVIIIIGNKNIV